MKGNGTNLRWIELESISGYGSGCPGSLGLRQPRRRVSVQFNDACHCAYANETTWLARPELLTHTTSVYFPLRSFYAADSRDCCPCWLISTATWKSDLAPPMAAHLMRTDRCAGARLCIGVSADNAAAR
jgi:hypothetical protein